jgi:hypothetical protein
VMRGLTIVVVCVVLGGCASARTGVGVLRPAVPDAATAMRIAEAVWDGRIRPGEPPAALAREAVLVGGVWEVSGAPEDYCRDFVPGNCGEDLECVCIVAGGVAGARIDRVTGRVLEIYLGR